MIDRIKDQWHAQQGLKIIWPKFYARELIIEAGKPTRIRNLTIEDVLREAKEADQPET